MAERHELFGEREFMYYDEFMKPPGHESARVVENRLDGRQGYFG